MRWLKSYPFHKSFPRSFTSLCGLPSRTITRIVSSTSRLLFFFFIIPYLAQCARLSRPFHQLLSARKYTVPYRIVSCHITLECWRPWPPLAFAYTFTLFIFSVDMVHECVCYIWSATIPRDVWKRSSENFVLCERIAHCMSLRPYHPMHKPHWPTVSPPITALPAPE